MCGGGGGRGRGVGNSGQTSIIVTCMFPVNTVQLGYLDCKYTEPLFCDR